MALREQHRSAIGAHKSHLEEIQLQRSQEFLTGVPRISYTLIPQYMVTGTFVDELSEEAYSV